jgi:hypothetical protein
MEAATATTNREVRRAQQANQDAAAAAAADADPAPEPEVEAVTSAPARIQQTEIATGEKVIIKFQKHGHGNMGRVIRVSKIINNKNDMPERVIYKWGTGELTVKYDRVARLPDQPAHENFDNAEAFAAAEQTYRQAVERAMNATDDKAPKERGGYTDVKWGPQNRRPALLDSPYGQQIINWNPEGRSCWSGTTHR